MKKLEPKMILNVQIDNEELEEKVKIAMDEYAENLILKNLDDKIQNIINRRIEAILRGGSWNNEGKIAGQTLENYVKEKSSKIIEDAIDKHIKEIFAKKFASLL